MVISIRVYKSSSSIILFKNKQQHIKLVTKQHSDARALISHSQVTIIYYKSGRASTLSYRSFDKLWIKRDIVNANSGMPINM